MFIGFWAKETRIFNWKKKQQKPLTMGHTHTQLQRRNNNQAGDFGVRL